MDSLALLNNLFGIVGGIIAIGGIVSKGLATRRDRSQNQTGSMSSGREMQRPPAAALNQRRFISHPVVFTLGMSAILVEYFLQASHVTNNLALGELVLICFIAQIGCWLSVLRSLVRMRRIGWIIGMLVTTIYSPIIYGLWGPTQHA